jgi:hypothetical protein
MEVHMQMVHNETLTAEQDAKIEKELDMSPTAILDMEEAELDKELDADVPLTEADFEPGFYNFIDPLDLPDTPNMEEIEEAC